MKRYDELKDYHRQHRETFSDNLALRTHRGLSWLKRAEMSEEDADAKFIFLWVAFNAIYTQEIESIRLSESQRFSQFIEKLLAIDENKQLEALVWTEFSGSIRLLLNNQYVYQPFWDYQNGAITKDEFETLFGISKTSANKALGNRQTQVVIQLVLSRIYTLRNQLIHGGSTWNSSVNRTQLKDGNTFLHCLVSNLLDIMMANPNTLWGDANYPVVKD